MRTKQITRKKINLEKMQKGIAITIILGLLFGSLMVSLFLILGPTIGLVANIQTENKDVFAKTMITFGMTSFGILLLGFVLSFKPITRRMMQIVKRLKR